jgi:hypothetical protein
MVGQLEIEFTGHSRARPETLMLLMKNWHDLPEYWHGMRQITDVGGGMYSVRFAFPAEGKMSYIWDRENMKCTENYHSGPFTGYKTVKFIGRDQGTDVLVRWDIKLSLRLILMKRFIRRHFLEGTENAITRLDAAALKKEKAPISA